jgi:hypothetical protein
LRREPIFRISHRLMKMSPGDQCAYLIACIKNERPDSVRRREFSKALVDARTAQIKTEIRGKR